MIIFIIHSVFVLCFLVEIAVVKFTILHPAFKLFFSGGFQYFSQSIAKINNPYFLSLGRSDDVFMFCAIIADTSFNGQALFFKIDVLPCQSANFCFCQYKSKKNLLLIRKKHHCFHPVMLLRTILFRLCFFFFVENVIHLPAYLHTTWFINKDFLNNL